VWNLRGGMTPGTHWMLQVLNATATRIQCIYKLNAACKIVAIDISAGDPKFQIVENQEYFQLCSSQRWSSG
jgi:hypothetical protein